MNAHKLQVKIYAERGSGAHEDALVSVFHSWIKHHTLPDVLIDVANYAHVPNGPGVALIGHGSDYFFEENEGRPALLYSRKRDEPAPAERLRDGFRRTLHAAALLEKEPTLDGKLRFGTGEFLVRLNDRLSAPNTDQTWAAVKPQLEAFATELFGADGFSWAREGSPKQLFTARLTVKNALPLPALLQRLGGSV